jgi:hypothetical protein
MMIKGDLDHVETFAEALKDVEGVFLNLDCKHHSAGVGSTYSSRGMLPIPTPPPLPPH